jgi:hypothetical protein
VSIDHDVVDGYGHNPSLASAHVGRCRLVPFVALGQLIRRAEIQRRRMRPTAICGVSTMRPGNALCQWLRSLAGLAALATTVLTGRRLVVPDRSIVAGKGLTWPSERAEPRARQSTGR